ncbi:MAG: SGNH/GDSL hydrolase family protein [Halobacteriovoraceae bacterium]|jgi:hypothetical protein|nr:SGNH/GDSL hydrolase family protein [Halobacteriovoraceae bacterium]MBT5093690.1 SGNH/GDSL hydrolase family protein [Halobacteriovoraceae bacterium]
MLKNLAITALTLLFLLTLGEISCRLFPYSYESKISVSFPPHFGHCYSSPGHSALQNYKKIIPPDLWDQKILKHPHCLIYDQQKRMRGGHPKALKQVLLVGDSFTFGEGVSFEESLGQQLARSNSDTNFMNFAYPGASIYQVARKILPLLKDAPFQRVLYFYNLNDLFPQSHPFSKGVDWNTQQQLPWPRISKDSPLLKQTFSELLKLLINSYNKGATTHNSIALYRQHYLDEVSPLYQKLFEKLETINQRVLGAGKKFELVIYPHLHRDFWGAYPFQKIHQKILVDCRRRNLNCLDGQRAFGQQQMAQLTVHPADQHPNGQANQLMAKFLTSVWKK